MKAKKILLSTIIATQVLTATVLAAPDEAIKEFNKVPPIKQEVKHFQGEVKLFIMKDGEKSQSRSKDDRRLKGSKWKNMCGSKRPGKRNRRSKS